MISADLVRADQQTMLIVGTFVAAQQDPAIWERFVDRMFDDWTRESESIAATRATTAEQAIAALGRIAAGRTAQPSMDAAETGNDAQPAPAPGTSPPATV